MSKTKLHLGCGPHILPGWVNYDLEPGPGGIAMDLTRPLPHANDSVDFVFSEHFIEHLTRPDALKLMKEIFRVLKPNGVCRISTPDLNTIVQDYVANKLDRWKGSWMAKNRCQMVNEGLRLWGHQHVFDRDDLLDLVREAKFDRFYIPEYRISSHSELKGLEVRPFHLDLIIEVIK